MRLIFRIIATPIMLLITIASAFLRFLAVVSGILLGIIAVVLSLVGVVSIFIFGFRDALGCLIFAFLISPMGIP